jgi:hypothetical protein
MFTASARKSNWARWAMVVRFTEVCTRKSKSSMVLTPGKRAAFTRAAPPWLSRALTSSASTAAR